MSEFDEGTKVILRNKLVGRWAAEKLGLSGAQADAYADALAKSALAADGADVFKTIRKDFDAAGVLESDDHILKVMTDMTLRAGHQRPTGGAGLQGAAAQAIIRKFTSRP